MGTILVIGTCDTKGAELAFLAERIRRAGHRAVLADVGTGSPVGAVPDVTTEALAGANWPAVADAAGRRDRGACIELISRAAVEWLAANWKPSGFDAIVSIGGGGGTAVGTAAMRSLPLGIPKLMVSTLASGETRHYVGLSDLLMMPSVVDFAGLNRISRGVLARAAGAIAGMVDLPKLEAADRPIIVASMFGNTTDCVRMAREKLEAAGYEVLVFHATGTGGRSMEALIRGGLVAGVLDVTTTEWADELVGGVLGAGPERLDAAGVAGVPAVVSLGCLDMVNFGERSTVPKQFAGRLFYQHNPQVTLMRTSVDESRELGRILAGKLNAYRGPLTVLLPTGGFSQIGAAGGVFHDPAADGALIEALVAELRPDIEVRRYEGAINEPGFATLAAETLLENLAN